MAVTEKVKATMALSGKSANEVSEHFGISAQAFRNKMGRQSFSAEDLIRLCDCVGGQLVIELGDNQRICFETSDIRDGK